MATSESGKLYIVATPIGNLKDVTLRALEVLAAVDLIAAEDTRQSKKLLENYNIKTSLLALHEHNEEQQSQVLLEKILAGKNIALISDAGTPLISDPGYTLVKKMREAGITVIPIPGACAAIAALSASGLPSDHFIFEGFLPAKNMAKLKRLETLQAETRTMIFYEAPHRLVDTIETMQQVFGVDRHAVLARELSKIFETIHADTLANLKTWITEDSNQERGEMVILVAGSKVNTNIDTTLEAEVMRLAKILHGLLPPAQITKVITKILSAKISRQELYKIIVNCEL
jgi:16S rRNA (cytidine1402-2'-O)-methyltransferase